MASISEPLLGAGAQAKNDWARAAAATSLTFTGEAEFRRGVELQLGINALASAEAGLARFVEATVRGNAFAEAKVGLQLQLPLNLFDQFGLAVGAQAVAQAAAGIEAGLGISVGDFIALIRQNPESEGLPIDLVLLLLEEATVGGKFEIHAAASAMAYASIQITGEVVKNPGFHVIVDAGLGLAAGVGYGGSFDLGLRDFRRFYGRAVDRTIDHLVEGIGQLLAADRDRIMPLVRALAPVASTSLRVAYEIGDYIAKNSPGHDAQAAADLSNHCVGVVLEEAQRFLFGRFLEAGLRSLERLVTRDVPTLAQATWDSLMPERQALAGVLRRMPEEPFQPTSPNAAYWSDLIARTTDLIARLPSTVGTDTTRGAAMVFAAAELLTEALKSRVNQPQAYAFAIGAGRVTAPRPSFGGPLGRQPNQRLRNHINGVLGRAASQPLDYGDLVAYLVDDGIVATLRDILPDVDDYLAVFQHPAVGNTVADVARVLLQRRDAFVADAAGKIDPQATLRLLLGLLDSFISVKISNDLVPAVNRQLADGNLKLYFNEVVVASLFFTKEVAFKTVLDWQTRPVDRSTFTEALAGVMTMLLGRSLVLVGDGFLASLQAEMQRACNHAAAHIESPRDPFAAMNIPVTPELKALVADTLRIGGEVFGPLPADTRRRLRSLLYDIMETLPPTSAAQSEFTDNLADQFFIPNEEAVRELLDELLAISRERFQLFVERVVVSGAEITLRGLEDFIRRAIEAVAKWIEDLGDAIKDLVDDLLRLDDEIKKLLADAGLAFQAALEAFHDLLDSFSAQALRNRLRDDVGRQFYNRAKDILGENDFYRGLPPGIRTFVRGVLRDVVEDVVESPILDPIFDAIGAIAGELDDLLDDVRELNPEEPLAPQLLDLVVDRIEDRIRDAFGGSRPRIEVGFTVEAFGLSHRFSLGTINLPFNSLFWILRDAIDAMSFYQQELEAAATSLATAFQHSIDLEAKQAERDRARDDHARLGRMRDEFSTDTKTITVVNPAQSVVYDTAADVHVHLGGVPASYLGLERDEQRRVFVFLNGELVPMQEFSVEPSPGPTQSLLPVAGGRLPGPGHVRAPVSDKAPPLRVSLHSLAPQRRGASAGPSSRQVLTKGAGRGDVATTLVTNVRPGRRMTASKRAGLVETLPPGTTLRWRTEMDRFDVGTNTLAVIVIDPAGQRYQHVVSFGIAARTQRPKQGAALPAMPGRKRGITPTSRADRIAVHFDRTTLGQRLTRAQAALASHSAGLLTGLRRR